MNVLNLTKGFAIAMFTLLTVTMTSCKKDVQGCMDATSDNFNAEATMDDGSCIPARDKFLGTFTVTTTCDGDSHAYDMGITSSSNAANEVVVTNIIDYGGNVTGTIKGKTITLVEKTLEDFTVKGSGDIDGDKITINLTLEEVDGSDMLNCVLSGESKE